MRSIAVEKQMNFFNQPSKYAALSDETEPIILSGLEKTVQCDSGWQKFHTKLNELWMNNRTSILKTILCLSLVCISAGLGALWARSQQQMHIEAPPTVVPDGEHSFQPIYNLLENKIPEELFSLTRTRNSTICLPQVCARRSLHQGTNPRWWGIE